MLQFLINVAGFGPSEFSITGHKYVMNQLFLTGYPSCAWSWQKTPNQMLTPRPRSWNNDTSSCLQSYRQLCAAPSEETIPMPATASRALFIYWAHCEIAHVLRTCFAAKYSKWIRARSLSKGVRCPYRSGPLYHVRFCTRHTCRHVAFKQDACQNMYSCAK